MLFSSNHNSGKRSNILASALEETMSGHATSSPFCIRFFFLSLSFSRFFMVSAAVAQTAEAGSENSEEIIYFLHCFEKGEKK
jgi:hypothetical protein